MFQFNGLELLRVQWRIWLSEGYAHSFEWFVWVEYKAQLQYIIQNWLVIWGVCLVLSDVKHHCLTHWRTKPAEVVSIVTKLVLNFLWNLVVRSYYSTYYSRPFDCFERSRPDFPSFILWDSSQRTCDVVTETKGGTIDMIYDYIDHM